jgi:EmrB/QacA subfamily drug resistance transporter
MLIVAFAFLMEQLDATIITTAIPDMARDLQVTPLQMSLTVTSYILSLAVFMPASSWIADRFGTRRVFAGAVGVFVLGSVLCGMSTNLPVLIAMRVLQGFGGAMMTPVGRLALLRSFPRDELAKVMAYMTVPLVLGPTTGPLLGGVLTTYASWRWIFYVNVPIGLLGMALAWRYVAEEQPPATPASRRFDILGFVICGIGLASLQFGLDDVGHHLLPPPSGSALIVLGVILLGVYYLHGRRTAEAVLDLSLFAIRTFRISSTAGSVSRAGVHAVPFMLPLLFQVGFGLSPVQSGSLTFATSLGTLVARPVSAVLLRHFGFRTLLFANAVVCAAVTAGFALTEPQTPRSLVLAHLLAFGIVRSTQLVTTTTLTYADVPAAKLSRSTSLGGVIQQLTISFGVASAAALVGILAGPGRLPTVADFHIAFVLIGVITLVSAPGFLRLTQTDAAEVSHHRPRRSRDRSDR